MTALDVFRYQDRDVRTLVIDGEPWFVARDVAIVLGYADPTNAIKQHCRGVANHHPIVDTLGRTQQARVISEPDVLRLIISSRLPAAQEFERWVFEDVLPAIRRTGRYGSDVEMLAALPSSKLLALAAEAAKRAETAEAKVAELAPRAAQADTFRQADGLRMIGDLANDLKVHAQSNFPGLMVRHQDVFDLAGRVGLVVRGSTTRNNQPTARAIEAGWVKPALTTFDTKTRGRQAKVYARLTPKGYGRLWDAAVNNLSTHGTVLPPTDEHSIRGVATMPYAVSESAPEKLFEVPL